MISLIFLVVMCFSEVRSDMQHAPVVRVDHKRGLSCMAADEEDLQLLMEQDEPDKPKEKAFLKKEMPAQNLAKPTTTKQNVAPVVPSFPQEAAPALRVKKKPRILRRSPSDTTPYPGRMVPEALDMRKPQPKPSVPRKKLLPPDTWLKLKAQEQRILQDTSALEPESAEFLRAAKEIMRVRKALAQEKHKMLESGWLEENLPFPEVLDDSDDVITLQELADQERVILARMRDSVMGGDEGSYEHIQRQRKALKEIKAQKALLQLNDVHRSRDVLEGEVRACAAPDKAMQDDRAQETAPVYNDDSVALPYTDDMEDDVIAQIEQHASPGLWQGASPRAKGGQRVGASVEQQWRHWT